MVARGRASCDRNRRARRDEELITRHDEPSSRARVEAALLDGAPLRPLQRCVLASALLVVALALSIGLEVWVRRYVGRSVEVANERARLVRWRRLHRSELNRARGGSVGRSREVGRSVASERASDGLGASGFTDTWLIGRRRVGVSSRPGDRVARQTARVAAGRPVFVFCFAIGSGGASSR